MAKTVRVKIFVSVSPQGGYLASGGLFMPENEIKDKTRHIDYRDAGYWIEADLPIPEPKLGNGSDPYNVTVTKAD